MLPGGGSSAAAVPAEAEAINLQNRSYMQKSNGYLNKHLPQTSFHEML